MSLKTLIPNKLLFSKIGLKLKYTRYRSLLDKTFVPGADPWIIPYKDSFLLTCTIKKESEIVIIQFNDFAKMGKAKKISVWKPSEHSDHAKSIWAPEIHYFPEISDKWYIYYAGCDGNNENHRMYVLESDTTDPLGSYHEIGKIYDTQNDFWAIDLTVLTFKNKLYAVWSGWEKEATLDPLSNWGIIIPQYLYIAPMSNPWTISGERVLISKPELSWEMSDGPINEGPQILKNNDKLFIIYSADASWTPAYKLGLLELKGDDPLNPKSWIKFNKPVFEQGKTKIYGPGHASFITGDQGNHIIYHNKVSSLHGWERRIRHQSFQWNQQGYPHFGQPR